MKKLKGTTTPFDFRSFIKTGQSVLDLQLKKAREEAPEVAQHTIDLVTRQTSIKQMNSLNRDTKPNYWEEELKIKQDKAFEQFQLSGAYDDSWQEDFIRTLLEEAKAEYEKTRAEEVMEASRLASDLERRRIADEYANLRDVDGRNLRFYLLPHTEHKEGDDGFLTENKHPKRWGLYRAYKEYCESRKKLENKSAISNKK